MDQIFQFGLAGVLAYGGVGIISLIAKKRFNVDISQDVKVYLLITIAFIVGWLPQETSDVLLNHLRDAVGIGMAIHAGNTVIQKLSGGA